MVGSALIPNTTLPLTPFGFVLWFPLSQAARIKKETARLKTNPVPGIVAEVDPSNDRYFHVVMQGPEQSCYEGGVFNLELFLVEDYPMSPPKVRFLTKVYHPNIDRVRLPGQDLFGSLARFLKDKWSPALQVGSLLLSIQVLLSAPNPDDPLANDVAAIWKSNEAQAMKTAREWTAKFAKA